MTITNEGNGGDRTSTDAPPLADEGSNTPERHSQDDEQSRASTPPPPLPPRPATLGTHETPSASDTGKLQLPRQSSRTQLQSTPTIALTLAGVHTQNRGDTASLKSSPASRVVSRKQSFVHSGRLGPGSDVDDTASLRSYAPTLETAFDNISLLNDESVLAWKASNAITEHGTAIDQVNFDSRSISDEIVHEFDNIEAVVDDEANESAIMTKWKSKLKHFFILSASGKPIYSRHGDDRIISNYIGIVQTLISSYQSTHDPLRNFQAGDTRFVILTKGPLNLVAISRLRESEKQLQNQLESLYMQILSTLTLPSLENMFSFRPSTDLRRPLQGTDVLLDGLADGFTRGSPSTLLSALECLRMRKTNRRVINDTLLKTRSPNLLYGLIVAAGRLVSVVRPKKHSLHPGDLHLIFNMLFEAGSVKAGGGENWIPLCLPGFNNTGYLYMYVSFLSTSEIGMPDEHAERPSSSSGEDEIAIVLISANKEGFYELRKMRDDLVARLEQNGSMAILKTAISKGHATCSELVPGTVLQHFLYKSRANVQFTMPSFEPHFQKLVARRRLMSLYHSLHESIHSRTAHLKIQHCVAQDATALAWETQLFELYCVAGPHVSRAAICQGANRVVQWIRREEERVFIIGGAVF